jgi:hypothetical protein
MFLESESLRVNSIDREVQIVDWWQPFVKSSIKIKINPEKDIIEYISGMPAKMQWEQLFSFDAAIREAKKLKKELPSVYDINSIFTKEELSIESLQLKSTWIYILSDDLFWNIDNRDYFWLKDKEILYLREDMFNIWDIESIIDKSWVCFCSVRCLKQ